MKIILSSLAIIGLAACSSHAKNVPEKDWSDELVFTDQDNIEASNWCFSFPYKISTEEVSDGGSGFYEYRNIQGKWNGLTITGFYEYQSLTGYGHKIKALVFDNPVEEAQNLALPDNVKIGASEGDPIVGESEIYCSGSIFDEGD